MRSSSHKKVSKKSVTIGRRLWGRGGFLLKSICISRFQFLPINRMNGENDCHNGAVRKRRRQLGTMGGHMKSRLKWTHKGVGV